MYCGNDIQTFYIVKRKLNYFVCTCNKFNMSTIYMATCAFHYIVCVPSQ